MIQGRRSSSILGLSLLAMLGLMAFMATLAEAGEYKLEGSTFTTKGTASETVAATIRKVKILVPGLKLVVVCTSGKASGTVLLGGTAHATTLLEGCTVEGNKFCKTFETKAKMESETEPGFLTFSGLGELVLMGGAHYILASSGAGTFGSVYLTTSAKGCTLPLEEPVRGSTVFFAPNALTPSVNQTVETLTQSELETLFPQDVLEYGNQVAWIDEGGTSTAALTGVNKGKSWGAE